MQKKVYRNVKIVCFAEKKLFFVGNVRKKQLFSAFRYNYLKRVLHNRSVYVIMQMKKANTEEGNTDVGMLSCPFSGGRSSYPCYLPRVPTQHPCFDDQRAAVGIAFVPIEV